MHTLRVEGGLSANQHDCYIVPRPAEELYDVREDPYSSENLAADLAYADVLARMRRVHTDWVRRTKDQVPADPTPDKFHRITGNRLG